MFNVILKLNGEKISAHCVSLSLSASFFSDDIFYQVITEDGDIYQAFVRPDELEIDLFSMDFELVNDKAYQTFTNLDNFEIDLSDVNLKLINND